ncbi:MAG: hypothetical protein V6Z89_06470 [Desulfobacter sp.]
MTALVLKCHDVLTVSAPGLPGRLKQTLDVRLGHFSSAGPDSAQDPADIVLGPMADPPALPSFARHMNHMFGFAMVAYQGRPTVCLLRNGQPEFCIFFLSHTRLAIHYRLARGTENRFYGVLLFAVSLAMKLKGQLLAHGSVVVREGRAVVISGHQGIGKTPLLLSLLRRGWQCLGDDKFFITPGKVWMAEPHVAVSQYHFDGMPWLAGFLPGRPASPLPKALARHLDRWAGMAWPSGLPVKIYRLLHPGMKIDLRNKPFSGRLAHQAVPVHWVILRRGADFSVFTPDREDGLESLARVQSLFFSHRMALEKTLCLYNSVSVPSVKEILAQNIPEPCFSLVAFSGEGDMDQLCDLVEARASETCTEL